MRYARLPQTIGIGLVSAVFVRWQEIMLQLRSVFTLTTTFPRRTVEQRSSGVERQTPILAVINGKRKCVFMIRTALHPSDIGTDEPLPNVSNVEGPD
jgi:hypothetical protein